MAEGVYPQMDERMLRAADYEAARYVEKAIKRRTATLEAQVERLQELVARLEAEAQDHENELRQTQEGMAWAEERAARLVAERDAWQMEAQSLKVTKPAPSALEGHGGDNAARKARITREWQEAKRQRDDAIPAFLVDDGYADDDLMRH